MTKTVTCSRWGLPPARAADPSVLAQFSRIGIFKPICEYEEFSSVRSSVSLDPDDRLDYVASRHSRSRDLVSTGRPDRDG
jgi:hypothetical protein